MNFIASVLLGITDNQEYKAFYIFIYLLQDKEIRMESLFFQGLPELSVMNFTFEKCIQKHCPKLFYHLRSSDMKTEYFTFKWNMTLFSCFLPYSVLIHIFDLFITEGWPSIYRVGVSLLNNFLAEPVMELDGMMEISSYFRDYVKLESTFSQKDIHAIIAGSWQVPITQSDLDAYKEDFYVQMAQQKMEEHKTEFAKKVSLPPRSIQEPKLSLDKQPSPNRSRLGRLRRP